MNFQIVEILFLLVLLIPAFVKAQIILLVNPLTYRKSLPGLLGANADSWMLPTGIVNLQKMGKKWRLLYHQGQLLSWLILLAYTALFIQLSLGKVITSFIISYTFFKFYVRFFTEYIFDFKILKPRDKNSHSYKIRKAKK